LYQDYWGFKEKAFDNTPDPRFFYASPKHDEALMRLMYAVQEKKGAAMLSGEYGSGKTLLSRIVLSKLMQRDYAYKVALVVNPAIPVLELLGEIVYQLGGEETNNGRKINILRNLNEILYRTSLGDKHTVIIIDEAQAIDESIFEELRLLLNFQLNESFLLTLLLLGQPELREKIDKIPQMKQRLAIQYHLTTLDESETKNYIEHRCKVAGRDEPLFLDGAYKLIYDFSAGVPRSINNICDLSLVIGMGEKAKRIDERIIKEVIHDFRQGQEAVKITEKV
jgi:type II secretory pathway predicted ATPase ExeA